MPEKKLSDLNFVDLYVCLDGTGTHHFHEQRTNEDKEVPAVLRPVVDEFANYLRSKFIEDEMGVTYQNVRMRAAKVQTAGGMTWAALRKISSVPPPIQKLGINPRLLPHIQNLGKRHGLVLVCGATGHGKTTTSCSMLNDFLGRLGGVAFTVEDPVEFDLEGRHDEHGFCYQVEVKEDHEWAHMLKRSLRWHPRYIFVGELRTPEAANQLLRAATSGHLVMTTMHAGSIEEGLEGIQQLAAQAVGDRATSLLASSLAAVFHQTITKGRLNLQFYITDPRSNATPFKNCIREKRIPQCRTFIDQQTALMMQTGQLFRQAGEKG